MNEKKHTPSYTAEFRERGVRLYREQRGEYSSDNAAYRAIAPKLGCSPDRLRVWCRQAERDAGDRAGLNSEERARLKPQTRFCAKHSRQDGITRPATSGFSLAAGSVLAAD